LLTLAVATLGPAAPSVLADGGMVMLPNGGQYEVALGAALDATNGTIYVSGFAGSSTTLAGSVLANGDLNTSFGGGVVLTQVAAVVSNYRGRDASNACAVQPDGKLVSAGWYVEGKPGKQTYGFALVRYNPNGTLDKTFNKTGIVKTSFGAKVARINAVVLQGDKILVTGSYDNKVVLARYTKDGVLDSGFGSGGKVITAITGGGTGIALHAGGIVVGASVPDGMAVIRFTANGSLDTTFGTDGVATFAVPDPDPGTYTQLYAIAVDPSGGIVVAGKFSDGETGNYHYRVALARFIGSGDLAGDLDPTFGGGNGYITFPPGLTDDYVAEAVAVDGDGNIVVAGYVASEGVTNLLVARFDEWGNPDPAFNTVGYAADFPGAAHSVFIQPDGKIVAAGAITDQGSSPQTSTIVIARYLPDGTPDSSF
jgi:uncharacterized delta-60 repeat protein